MTTTLVLVHGAWGRPEDWDLVIEHLPPELATRCADLPTCRHADASLEDDVSEVTAIIQSAADDDIVLVGHSYGGCVITGAGGHPAVSHLVYVASYMPDEGESMMSAKHLGDAVHEPATVSGVITLEDWEVDDGTYSADAMARKRERPRRPWSARAMYDPVGVPAWKTVPSTFVVATRDTAIPPALQREHARRADHVVELSTPHFPSFEQPIELAAVIAAAARRQGEPQGARQPSARPV